MGGKRPDQHNIDPSEAGATDYKDMPQTGRGNSDDLDTPERDAQRLSREQQEAKNQPLPPRKPAPSRDAKEGEKIPHEQPGAAEADTGKENPLA